MGSSFTSSCAVLAAIYATFAAVAFLQLSRVYTRDASNAFSSGSFWPNTIQQQVFIIVLLISIFRVAFFLVAINAWNSNTGEVTSEKVLFYSLDEFSTMLFFSLTSILALFWAELYYISIQKSEVFTGLVRPVTYFINVGALIAIAICSFYFTTSNPKDVDYVFVQFTITIAIIYLLGAIMFTYYARMAAAELKQVPVMLSARRERMRLLRMIALIFVLCLLIKAIFLISLTGHVIDTNSTAVLVGMFFFYVVLENFPMATVLAFYQVESTGDLEDRSNPSELQPLEPSNSSSPSKGWTFGASKSSSGEGLDAAIARLSVDTVSA